MLGVEDQRKIFARIALLLTPNWPCRLQAQTEYETQLHYDLPTTESQEKSQQSGERGNIPY